MVRRHFVHWSGHTQLASRIPGLQSVHRLTLAQERHTQRRSHRPRNAIQDCGRSIWFADLVTSSCSVRCPCLISLLVPTRPAKDQRSHSTPHLTVFGPQHTGTPWREMHHADRFSTQQHCINDLAGSDRLGWYSLHRDWCNVHVSTRPTLRMLRASLTRLASRHPCH